MNSKWKSIGAVLATASSGVLGASLHVAPVSIQMAPGQSAATIDLSNEGDEVMHAQVRVFAWDQNGGKDNLTPTQTMVASPPMIDVAPKGKQTIRLVRMGGAPAAREESYRVLIDEIIDPAAEVVNGVNVQLRYSVPVFTSPAGMQPPRVTVTADVGDETLSLKAENSGGQHANVSAVTLENKGGESVPVEPGLVGYVLVGQSMEWNLRLPADAAAKGPFTTIRCRFNGEDSAIEL